MRTVELSAGKMVRRQNDLSRRCSRTGTQSCSEREGEETEPWPPSFSGDNSEESKEQGDFQGEMNKLQKVFGPESSGHREEPLWSKSGRISASELWGGKKRKHKRPKYNRVQKNGPQAKQTKLGWLIFFSLCTAAQLEFIGKRTKLLPK